MIGLWLLGVALGVLGVTVPSWNEWFPRLGLAPLYHLRLLRSALAVASLAVVLGAYALRPSPEGLAVFSATALLAGLAYLVDPRQGFVAVDRPVHASASHARLGGNALVLGIEMNGMACAWPLEMIVPHHIVNDDLGQTPVLVVY